MENLAALARIELAEDEKVQILKDMQGILEYVNQIKEAEVGEVEVDQSVRNVWREDVTEPREFSRDLIIKQFPAKQDDFLKVKKIL